MTTPTVEASPVQFNAQGNGPLLEGYLYRPAGAGPFPTAVVCHPHSLMGGSMRDPVVLTVCRALAESGWIALRFNFRGVGNSGGFFSEGQGELDDVAGAIDFLAGQKAVDIDHLAVIGYSFGAEVGLHHAAQDHRVSWLVGIALIQANYGDPFLDRDGRPKLFIVGENDAWAPLEDLRAYFARLSPPKTLKVIPCVDHFFFGLENEVANVTVNFLNQDRSPEAQKKSSG